MEHIIYSEIMTHLEIHNILSDMQFGFRKRRSAELQLLQAIHDLAFDLNRKSQTDVTLLDFSKAFDRVSHRHLITKLEYYGIRNNILNWVASFLSGCTQQVVCGGCYSSPTKVLSGVPQGSVLGPLLFLIYVNDILYCVDSTCRLYADDCILYRHIDSLHDTVILQRDLLQLEHWSKQWKMLFNIDKCTVLSVTLKQHPFCAEYFLYRQHLASVSSANYLGVIIDTKLTFNNHLDHVCKKANSVLAFLRRNFRLYQCKIKSDVYLTYVRPILEYAVSVWAPHTKRSIYKLESIQRRAARFVMGDFQRTSIV